MQNKVLSLTQPNKNGEIRYLPVRYLTQEKYEICNNAWERQFSNLYIFITNIMVSFLASSAGTFSLHHTETDSAPHVQ
jgi:hypothetical protein